MTLTFYWEWIYLLSPVLCMNPWWKSRSDAPEDRTPTGCPGPGPGPDVGCSSKVVLSLSPLRRGRCNPRLLLSLFSSVNAHSAHGFPSSRQSLRLLVPPAPGGLRMSPMSLSSSRLLNQSPAVAKRCLYYASLLLFSTLHHTQIYRFDHLCLPLRDDKIFKNNHGDLT